MIEHDFCDLEYIKLIFYHPETAYTCKHSDKIVSIISNDFDKAIFQIGPWKIVLVDYSKIVLDQVLKALK